MCPTDGVLSEIALDSDNYKLCIDTGLFQLDWYVRRYSEVLEEKDPLAHYLTRGGFEGLDPHPLFDSDWYLARYPDVVEAGDNPLLHFLIFGAREGRNPHPLFDSGWYLAQLPNAFAAKDNPLAHYLKQGGQAGRDPHPLFNSNWYLAQNPDVALAGNDPLIHYLEYGAKEGRDPHPLFDSDWYLTQNRDVAEAGDNPLLHYLAHGAREGRFPHPDFDTGFYLWNYPDVVESGLNPLLHFVIEGKRKGYTAAPIMTARPVGEMARLLHEPQRAPSGPEWIVSFLHRLRERLKAIETMNITAPLAPGRPTFSLTTTVYDTNPIFVNELARTVLTQAFEDFEWLILDNGSTSPATISTLRDVAESDQRFKLFRVEDNLHIIGGNRYLLGLANGHYIVPIDSDDLLYPDSLALFANVLRHSSKDALPCLIYSDEQKVTSDGEPFELIWRWDFNIAHAMSTAPAAHLMAFSTDIARESGVYTGEYARGSHDWDTALRIAEKGGRTAHVADVLYGWRMHELSTANASAAKDYIGNSQIDVLNASLKRRSLDHLFRFELLFDSPGWYRPVRKHVNSPRVEIDFVLGPPVQEISNLRNNLGVVGEMPALRRIFYPFFRQRQVDELRSQHTRLNAEWIPYHSEAGLISNINEIDGDLFAKFIVASNLRIKSPSAIWDAIGVLELDCRAGVVSGPVVGSNGIMLNAGMLEGVGGFVGSPFFGWAKSEIPGTFWQINHGVSVAPTFFLAIRGSVFGEIGGITGIDVDDAIHGLDFCRRCAQADYAIVYTSGMECERDIILVRSVGEGSTFRAQSRVSGLLEAANVVGLSRHLSLHPDRFGLLKRAQDEAVLANMDCTPLNPALPLNINVNPSLECAPTLNLLLPGVRMSSMSGGPNTALNLVYRLAMTGFPIRIISTDVQVDPDSKPIMQHIMALAGTDEFLPHVEIVDASDRSRPFSVGAKDVFVATAWWTAQMAKHAAKLLGNRPFVYLIQDFEPLLHPASTQYALALETYTLDHIPVINTSLLWDYLCSFRIGRHGDPDFAAKAIVFDPAFSTDSFYFDERRKQSKRRRLLFYARPTTGLRNLFDIGVLALRSAIANGVLSPLNWTFLGIGEQFENVDLGHGAVLECAPWLSFDDYAELMRTSDVLLSLMLSPHPSYPPLEMAACGGLVVTNSFANKTPERMAAISRNIIAVEPTIEAIGEALEHAVARLDDVDTRRANSQSKLPTTWDESFADALPRLTEILIDLGLRQESPQQRWARIKMPVDDLPSDAYGRYLRDAQKAQNVLYAARQEPGLISFVTTVWNTAPEFLEVLARSVREQTGGTNFEWFVLDNGSRRAGTLTFLKRLEGESFVRLERVEENLGIVGGMRYCLERAIGRYIIPLDSDDYIFRDTVRIATWHIRKSGYPPLLYSDETLLSGVMLRLPYMKPDWDPVLFVNSCYIAHLGIIDRELALKYDAYTDRGADGSHDWDTFTRFFIRGHTPIHIPEVLYAWRIHDESTTGNINSKPYVYSSQKTVLSRFLEAQPAADHFELQKSPLFGLTPDWWLRRIRIEPRPLLTVLVRSRSDGGSTPNLCLSRDVDHRLIEVDLRADLAALEVHVRSCITEDRLIHILASETQPDDDEWYWEAMGLFELFPDSVMVGGRIHSHRTILSAGFFFGFGSGCDCPDYGRSLSDPGYFAQLWKPHSVSAVSMQHAVMKPEFLLDVIQSIELWNASITYLDAWCGAVARRRGRRVVYSPFVSAETFIDWRELVSKEEMGRFVSACADVMPEQRLLSPNVGLTKATAYTPLCREDFNPGKLGVLMPQYTAWFEHCVRLRASTYPLIASGPHIAILTTLYSRTDAELFKRTAQSVLGQTYSNFQWCLLAHGPIVPELDTVLRELSRNSKVRLLRLPKNLGIVGGMRYVLDESQGDYVLPLDGDDLLTADCLQILAATIAGLENRPVYIYSDEDIIVDEQLKAPVFRPCWDPVLDLENSWIWHSTVFRRDIALEIGVYTDSGCEYCHDWDTLYRFTNAGYEPFHVPEITYHWRHHAGSTSNSGKQNTGSSDSVQHLLARKVADRGMSAICDVVPFPIFRGAEEWCIRRKPMDLRAIRRVVICSEDEYPHKTARLGYGDTCVVISRSDSDGLAALTTAVADLDDSEILMFISQHVDLSGSDWLPEVNKLFEFHDEVAIVSGRVLAGEQIVRAGLMLDGEGNLVACYDGRTVYDPNQMALAWKPQCIAVPVLDLCFVRASIIKEVLHRRPTSCTFEELSIWMGVFAQLHGHRIAYSPLVTGEINGPLIRPVNRRVDTICWDEFRREAAKQELSSLQKRISHGAARYANVRFA